MRYDGTKWTSSRSGFERNIRSVAAQDHRRLGGRGRRLHRSLRRHWADRLPKRYDGQPKRRVCARPQPKSTPSETTKRPPLPRIGWQPHPAGYATIAQDVKGIWAFAGTNIWTVATTTTSKPGLPRQLQRISYSGYTPTDPAGMNRVVNVNGMWATQQGCQYTDFLRRQIPRSVFKRQRHDGQYKLSVPAQWQRASCGVGASATDVWVVGDNGFVIQYDGAWKNHGPCSANLYGVWKSAPTSELWMVGDLGMVWKYDGTAWAVKESTTRNKLQAITGISTTDFWVGGSNGTMLHTQPQ